jgi:hypothetical protein
MSAPADRARCHSKRQQGIHTAMAHSLNLPAQIRHVAENLLWMYFAISLQLCVVYAR